MQDIIYCNDNPCGYDIDIDVDINIARCKRKFLIMIYDDIDFVIRDNLTKMDLFDDIDLDNDSKKMIISSDRSSCTDDGLLYIYPSAAAPTFSDFHSVP